MSDARIPEWFIGGPMDGKDRLIECPDADTNEVRTVDFSTAALLDEATTATEYSYRRTRFAIGRQTLTLWIMAGMDRLDAGNRLAEILLAPHLTEAP